ncbi:hypothetical protein LCGC14_2592480 [marine sediment metagenome]|uniref:Uncharacterized protein n=1 Tax=marine sediment metagenome TaxID=412755 RepID=A0A0F9AB84_9ZZZZ
MTTQILCIDAPQHPAARSGDDLAGMTQTIDTGALTAQLAALRATSDAAACAIADAHDARVLIAGITAGLIDAPTAAAARRAAVVHTARTAKLGAAADEAVRVAVARTAAAKAAGAW